MIRILLVDDQALLCEVLKTWLEVEEDFQVAGVAHDGEEAIEQVAQLQPDIILMDIDMPKMNGLEATQLICERFPNTKVIFLSAHDDEMYFGKSLQAGAKGYLLKNTTAEELADKIRSVHYQKEQILPVDEEIVSAMQRQLEELVQTYQYKFQQQLEAAKMSLSTTNSTGINSDYEKRLSDLETVTKTGWESVRSEILSVQSQFSEANRSLSSQINQQVVNLKRELDSQLANALEDWSRQRAALQEWAVQRDEMRVTTEDFDSKYRSELMRVINPIRTSLQDTDRQLQVMRNGLIASILVATMALSFSGWVFLFNLGENNNSSARQSSEQIESSRR